MLREYTIVFSGPPRYGGDFHLWGGFTPRLQTPRGGVLPPENYPPVRGGFCDFGGGSGGSAIFEKPLDSPPVRGESSIVQGGVAGDGNEK